MFLEEKLLKELLAPSKYLTERMTGMQICCPRPYHQFQKPSQVLESRMPNMKYAM